MIPKRVLIVHPDPVTCRPLSSRLSETSRLVVRTAHDGFEAAAGLFGGIFDCLILHASTPGLDPASVTRLVRSDRKMARLPILVLYRKLSGEMEQELRRAGVNGLMGEPFELEILVTNVFKLTGIEIQPRERKRPPKPRRSKGREKSAERPKVALGTDPESSPRLEGVPKGPARIEANLFDKIWNQAKKGPQLPGLPPGTSRIGNLITGELGDFVSKDLIAFDPSLVVGILRMANSIHFGGLEPIAGLARALLRIGQRNVARYILDTWGMRVKTPDAMRDFIAGSFSRHALMVACIAEEIAAHIRYRNPDAVYSAGLLHDVGKLFLFRYFEDAYLEVQRRTAEIPCPRDEPLDVSQIEVEVLSIDHGLIGYELCRAWGLPPVVQAGTLHHQLDNDRTRWLADAQVTMIVAIADLVDQTLGQAAFSAAPGMALGPADRSGGHDRGEELPPRAGGDPGRPAVADEGAGADTLSQQVLETFYQSIYKGVPYWVHRFLQGKQIPLRHAYETASRRVNRAVRVLGLESYGPSCEGTSPERRKTG